MWNEILALKEAAGWIAWPLAFAAFGIWACIGMRLFVLRRFTACARASQNKSLNPYGEFLGTGRVLLNTLVIVAPLLGLLGTVSGMVETFNALGDNALFSQSGGIAGGIAAALVTTEMGLVAAVPGVVIGRLLNKREQKLLRGEEARVATSSRFVTAQFNEVNHGASA